jgi:3-isopropylmalate/(R)-2-methylmalate dehydratase large subunit
VLAPVANAAVHALSRMSGRPPTISSAQPASSVPSGSTNGSNSTGATARGHNTKGDRMGMTMIEKILARAAGREQVQAGDTVVCRVDMNILIDLQFICWVEPLKIADPRRVAIILDHAVPAPTVADADAGVRARAFARIFGIERFFDVGRHGICHQVIAENALALPGQVLTCTDSHTCAGGAYNNAARGLGPAE